MDEAKHRPPIDPVKKIVARGERLDETSHPIDKVLLAFTIVVQVNFDIANAVMRHLGKWIEQVRPVLFFRIEEAVDWSTPRRVGNTVGDLRPSLPPQLNAVDCYLLIGVLPKRLVMVGDGNPDTLRLSPCPTPDAAIQVSGKPNLSVTG
jgi:hypothetical protein